MFTRAIPGVSKYSNQNANLLPDSFVQEVRSRASLRGVIENYVPLKKMGASLVGLCPFHSEKSPSFSVSEEKGFYYCFGCGEKGDAITFLMRFAGQSFRESIEELAGVAGISMPSSENAKPVENYSVIYQRLELAHKFYRHCLKHTEAPKGYLKGRGVTAQTASDFLIGYAPQGWQSLSEPFGADVYANDPELVKASLVREKDARRYDVFRDRLMFAIRDTRGRVIGFGGRSMDGSDPKYLNSPESPVFDKSSTLFGFHEARTAILAEKSVVVVEGYMDVVMMSQAGVRNTVATMGTACTVRHIERLCAIAPLTVFTFDGDAAGQRAAWRAMEQSLPYVSESHEFRFCTLPDGSDPDDVVKKGGLKAIKECLDGAQTLHQFMFSELSNRHNKLATPEDRVRFHTEGASLIKRFPMGSSHFRIFMDDLNKISQVGSTHLQTIRNASRTQFTRSDTWDKLRAAVNRFPATAKQLVGTVVDSLRDDDYALIEDESFSGQSEKDFWETFLVLVDLECPEDDPPKNIEESLFKDSISSMPALINRQLKTQRVARINNKHRSGDIEIDDFIKSRSANVDA